MKAWMGLMVLAVLLGGCSVAEDKGRGEHAVARFHHLFAASEYSQIYADTTDGFREANTETEFVEFMGAVRRKLGNIRSCELTGIEVNWDSGGTSISLSYHTAYQQGDATEQFVWVMEGEKALLESYQIDSKELILR